MKKLLLLAVMAVSGFFVRAQSYTFSQTTGTYTNLATPFVLSSPGWNGTNSYNLAIPFPFAFAGTTESILGIGGNTLVGFQFGTRGISVLLADLEDRNQSAVPSTINYQLTGTAGNQILKLEWKNAGTSSGNAAEFANMQVWLYEGSNIVEVHYGPSSLPASGFLYFPQPGPTVGVILNTNMSSFTTSGIFLQGNPAAANAVTINNSSSLPTLSTPPANGTIYRFTPATTTSVSEDQQQSSLTFFPNPTTDFISVKGLASGATPASLTLTDMTGKTVLSQTVLAGQNVAIGQLPQGTYLAQLITEAGRVSRRIVKL